MGAPMLNGPRLSPEVAPWTEIAQTLVTHFGTLLFVDSRRQIAQSQNRRRMCEIRLTKLSCAAQQESIVHFYAVTDIKGLSCPL